ncbi:MAG: hypothetical protein O2999_15050 [Nitrospirae bacterium]|nr:hypothetical protein [Nitrospirota bacterium]MDA1305577.1 hypothetical protein [Nitrospirota bacterium]
MERPQTNQWYSLLLAVAISSLVILNPLANAQMDGWLITPEEAAMTPAADADPLQGGAHFDIGREDLDIGPIIDVQKPIAGKPLNAPIEISVTFKPRSHPIDLTTLEVVLVKFINIDITDRVVDYVSDQGIQLKEAKIPSGSHRVRVSVADTTGAVSTRDFLFEVL